MSVETEDIKFRTAFMGYQKSDVDAYVTRVKIELEEQEKVGDEDETVCNAEAVGLEGRSPSAAADYSRCQTGRKNLADEGIWKTLL